MVCPGADARKEQYGQPRKHPHAQWMRTGYASEAIPDIPLPECEHPAAAATAISAALLIDAGRTTTVMSAAPQPSR